ncbi:MAG TPA: hypothetical protein VHT04_11720 [Stellaceae bacterium]|jgi:hypothetical protein|nr:hypothetical protein [Stellaceae bacterium]
MSNGETADNDLRQADLSHLQLGEMTAAQRAEIRRRYADFIKRLAKPTLPRTAATPAQSSTKWVPGKKVTR